MGGCQSTQKKPRRSRSGSRPGSKKQRSNPSVIQNPQVPPVENKPPVVVQPVEPEQPKVEVVEEELTGLARIQKKYGVKGIKTLLAKADSPYQSLSFMKVNQKCDELVDEIESRGADTIDEYKQNSENDFKEVLTNLDKENQGAVKKAEVTSRKPIQELLGFHEEMAKYEEIRGRMKEGFSDQKYQLKKVIKEQTRKYEQIDVDEHIDGYDDQEYQTRILLKDEAEDQYGRRWSTAEDDDSSAMESMEKEFNENHKPKFERLIPTKELDDLRARIKQNFEVAAREAVGTSNVCC